MRYKLIVMPLAVTFLVVSAQGATLFQDQFSGPRLSSYWKTTAPATLGMATYVQPSKPSFSKLNGDSVLLLHNSLNDDQYTGYIGSSVYKLTAFSLEIRFNTEMLSPSTSVDGFISLAMLDGANNTSYAAVLPFAGLFANPAGQTFQFGGSGIPNERSLTSIAGTTSTGSSENYFVVSNNTWYRLVLAGSKTNEVEGCLFNDNGSIKYCFGLGFTLSDLPNGFKIGLFQFMGTPGQSSPSAVAIDYVRLSGS